jgi:RNA polymerase sigma-70 factor (ECF subfamily)
MEDEKIIRLIAEQNEQGLIALRKKYQPFIDYLLHGMLGAYPQDLEECANDIELKLWNGLKQYDENKSSLKTYITHVVRNTAIDRLRKLEREHQHIDQNVDLNEKSQEHSGQVQSAEDVVFSTDTKNLVLNAISKLKKSEQEIFYRKYYYLQPVAQIAAELDCSEKSVESKLFRIRKKLQKYVEEV